MATLTVYESGGYAGIVSLAGVVSVNRGRKMLLGSVSAPTTGVQAFDNNPRRISALIQNRGSVNLNVYFDLTTLAVVLLPGESFQIDQNYPWTGQVTVQGAGATCNPVYVNEVSVA